MVCCLLGAALRFHGLFANSFHADEALFAGWARLIAVWRDPLLLTQAVDKPPLLFYLQALFYPLFGPVEWAARIPSLVASLLLIPATGQLAHRLTGDTAAAALAATLVAVSPLAVQFSATAFSDPLLTFWLVVALYCAARPAPLATGLLFGLALATKYQAALFIPLWIGTIWLAEQGALQANPQIDAALLPGLGSMRTRRRMRPCLGATAGLLGVIVALFIWQSARSGAGGLVLLQWVNIGGVRLAHSWELWSRLVELGRLWLLAFGWPMIVLAAGAAVGLAGSRIARAINARRVAYPTTQVADSMLALFILGYSALHWLWAVPVWDRYLLPILPLVAILVARAVSLLWAAVRRARPARAIPIIWLVVLAVVQLPIVAAARGGRLPIGGRPDADGGAAPTAQLLKDAPYGAVLYDHWYSWHWRYQLFDSRVYVSWFPDADALLADLNAFGGGGAPRYIVLPSSDIARPIVRRLSDGGYRLEPLAAQDKARDMTLYRIIIPEAAGD